MFVATGIRLDGHAVDLEVSSHIANLNHAGLMAVLLVLSDGLEGGLAFHIPLRLASRVTLNNERSATQQRFAFLYNTAGR